jgi:hypothetical protein
MIILISSKVRSANIQASLGKPEYSYFFLMKDFLPVLERVGTVIQVQTPDEIESLHARYTALGEAVIFISFTPPHQTPLNLTCPTVTLFAWEFDSLPSVAWDNNPQNDWRYVFAHSHGAIATSREVAQLVKEAVPNFPAIALPAPVWDRYAALGCVQGHPVELGKRQFPFAGIVIDSPLLGLSADGLVRKRVSAPHSPQVPGEGIPEQATASLTLREAWKLSVALLRRCYSELKHARPVGGRPPVRRLDVQGVVYTTVLNPADGRKNWIDLITAFCWAFKHNENATLIVKMTHNDPEYYRVALMTLLSRLAPFQCRVLILHGFLEDEQYQALIQASNYYVNASSCEGLCLPLMEFLASGKPAIAPDHTAMADYVNDTFAFVLQTSLEPTCWPQDPAGMMLTHRHRLNWESLMKAFRHSYQVALEDPARAQRMSSQAYLNMRDFASVEQVHKPLKDFLEQVLSRAKRPAPSLQP